MPNPPRIDIDRRSRPIPDTNKLKKMFKAKTTFIDKVGVELEGGWDEQPDHMKHDGSVSVQAPYVGEIAGPPLAFGKVLRWVYDHNPPFVNDTCGMHVHVSFKRPLDYARLADDSNTLKYINDRLKSWGNATLLGKIRPSHPFWVRLEGGNRYCKKEWHADKQMNAHARSNFRYTQLNFCYAEHQTLEVRTLPAFADPMLAADAVYTLVRSIEQYLREMSRPREKRIVVDLDAGDTLIGGAFNLDGEVPLSGNVLHLDGEVDTIPLIANLE